MDDLQQTTFEKNIAAAMATPDLCFLRHLSADAAMATLKQALLYKHWITAVGLDSSKLGHPPEKAVGAHGQ